MLKHRLTYTLFTALTLALLAGTLLLGAQPPRAAAAPLPVLTASAQPPTPTVPSPTPTVPSPTPTTPPTITPTREPGGAPPGTPTTVPTPPPAPERRADPAVAKEANQDEVELGGELTYSIIVTNEGNDTAVGVIVEDTLPSYLQLLAASVDKGEAVVNGNTAGFWIGNVEPGEVVRGTITARVIAIPDDGVIVNEAVLRSNSSTDRISNNRSSAQVRVRQPGGGALTPTPLPEGLPTPTPTPDPLAPQSPPPPVSLPVTAGTTSLPPGLIALVILVAVGYMAVGVHFWRGPRD